MRVLTVSAYDASEKQAQIAAPNRIVECCQPVTFSYVGYPVRIDHEKAAWRYADCMQEGRSETAFPEYVGSITADEMPVLLRVAEKVARLSQDLYGIRLVPRSSLLRSINVVRQIRYIFPGPATVLEIGPGSGYVGAMLLEMGYKYLSTEVTQAFYVWQNHLLNAIAPGEVSELATETDATGRAVHIPWWKFVVVEPAPFVNLDVATCNHALCEMHAFARAYTLRHVRSMFSEQSVFLVEGWGSTVKEPIWRAAMDFHHAGLAFGHVDQLATVATLKNSPLNTSPLPIKDDAAGEEFQPHIYSSDANQVSRFVTFGQQATRANGRFSLADLDVELRRIAGTRDLRTSDEKFLEFCGIVGL